MGHPDHRDLMQQHGDGPALLNYVMLWLRPVGIGKVTRRIIGTSIAKTIGKEIREAAGPLQTCAGHLSGCEAAVHAMHEVFDEQKTEGVILVDATNAFNRLNRQTALLNTQ